MWAPERETEVLCLCEFFWDQVMVGHNLDGCAFTQQHCVEFSSGGRDVLSTECSNGALNIGLRNLERHIGVL